MRIAIRPTERDAFVYVSHNAAGINLVQRAKRHVKMRELWNHTYEATPFVVGASRGSLIITPSPMGRMFLFKEWLIM